MNNKAYPENKDNKNTAEKETNVLDNNVSRETILSEANFTELYKMFRDDGMGMFESFYNAAYLSAYNTYESSDTVVKKKYENVHEHPKGWVSDKKKMNRLNKWSLLLALLEFLAMLHRGTYKIKSGISKCIWKISRIPGSMDNSLRAIKAFFRV